MRLNNHTTKRAQKSPSGGARTHTHKTKKRSTHKDKRTRSTPKNQETEYSGEQRKRSTQKNNKSEAHTQTEFLIFSFFFSPTPPSILSDLGVLRFLPGGWGFEERLPLTEGESEPPWRREPSPTSEGTEGRGSVQEKERGERRAKHAVRRLYG